MEDMKNMEPDMTFHISFPNFTKVVPETMFSMFSMASNQRNQRE